MVLFWFRRDLRLLDNKGLFEALMSGKKVLPIFIFDQTILSKLNNPLDKRVLFIHNQLSQLKGELQKFGSDLKVFYGNPLAVFNKLVDKHQFEAVFSNEDYEPYAKTRDHEIQTFLTSKSIQFHQFKDHVIFAKDDVLKPDGKPYTVFTPYSRKWKAFLSDHDLRFHDINPIKNQFVKVEAEQIISLEQMGFQSQKETFPSKEVDSILISQYEHLRDFPSKQNTSLLGIHLRFGTLSIRQLVKNTKSKSVSFLNELIWRDFYQMILWHFPHVEKNAFKPKYDRIEWINDTESYDAWCEGRTGYPIVDAGMRQLIETGFMHNRIRMVVASFLCKHLLIHWQWGEDFFAKHLLDFDLASNNGGWQWASGSGCDAAPYFRVFNPTLQTQKFDPDFDYIKRWVPEYTELTYPKPIVDHKFARERAIEYYKRGIQSE